MIPSKAEVTFMERAIEIARNSPVESNRDPYVGAVVVSKDGELLGGACRGQFKSGDHAEYSVLETLLGKEVKEVIGATVYTTLEPCTTRNHPNVPCAKWLIHRGVARVVIGMLDP